MAETTKKQKRRWPKVLLFLFVLVLILLWFAPVIVAKTALKQKILASAAGDLKGSVTVDSINLGWFSPIEVNGITVKDDQGNTIATVESATTDQTLFQIARNQSRLGTITIMKPTVTVICDDTTTNLETLLEKYLKDKQPKTTKRPHLKIVWADGQVTVRDAVTRSDVVFSLVVGEAMIGDSIKLDLKANSTSPVGSVSVEGEMAESMKVMAKVNQLPLPEVGWLVRRFERGLETNGIATGEVTLTGSGSQWKAVGRMKIMNFETTMARIAPDRIVSSVVESPFEVTTDGTMIRVANTELNSDFGQIKIAGAIDTATSYDRWLAQPGLAVKGDVDIPKLTKLLPKTVPLLPGTSISQGQVTLDIRSQAAANGRTTYAGSLKSTPIRGTRDGQPLSWESPIVLDFSGQLDAELMPTFDRLTVQSDFVAVNARGHRESFELAANVDLGRLKNRLGEFVDLRNFQLAGTGTLRAWNRPANGVMSLEVSAEVKDLLVGDTLNNNLWREPALKIQSKALAKREKDDSYRVDSASGQFTAGEDSLTVELVEPIRNLNQIEISKANVAITGDLARWKSRLGRIAGIPNEWQMGGRINAKALACWKDKQATLQNFDGGGTNVVFRGAGLTINEPAMRLSGETVTYHTQRGDLEIRKLHMGSETLACDSDKLTVRPTDNPPTMNGTLQVAGARLSRIQKALGWQTDPRGGDQLEGLAKGTVQVSTKASTIEFDGQLSAEQVRYGSPQQPLWQEPTVKVQAKGQLDFPNDRVTFERFRVESASANVEANGKLTDFAKTMSIDVNGMLEYDLAKVEPQVKGYLGRNGRVAGKDKKPFSLKGSLASGPQNVTVHLPNMVGNAAASWTSVRAYGFDVGAANVNANLANGILSFDMIKASFGQGQVAVKPKLMLNPGRYDLTIEPGRIVDQARLTPAACADALGYALPAIANSTEANGLVSVDLTDAKIPLADYTKMTAKGQLFLHSVTVTPGPVIREILTAANVSEPSFSLAQDQKVPVWVENGRVHHQNLTLASKNVSLKTSGSVGFDGTMQLNIEMPIPARLIEQAFRNNPRIKDALQKKTVTVAMGGTVNRPTFDARAFQANLQKLITDASRDAVKDAAGDLLQKELNKGLEQLLPKKKP